MTKKNIMLRNKSLNAAVQSIHSAIINQSISPSYQFTWKYKCALLMFSTHVLSPLHYYK